MKPFLYTNPTSSDLNLDLYSKQVGGDQCNMVCKKNCKQNCSTYCQLAKEDKTEFKTAMDRLKEKRNKLREYLKVMESKEKEYEQKRIRYLIDHSLGLDGYDRQILHKLKKGGTKRRKKRTKRTRGGFNWFSNSSLAPCEKSCTDKCESQCKPICTDASYLAHDIDAVTSLESEIKLLELSITHIKSKLNL